MVVFLGYDPRRQYVYETIVQYFQNPVLYKIPSRDPDSSSALDMYGIRIESFLLKERRFLIVMVQADPQIPHGHARPLSELFWTVLQTRNLTEEEGSLDRLPAVRYEIRRDSFEGYALRIESSTDEVTTYRVAPPLPMKIHLLHKKKGRFEYADQGTILAAIETYQTLLCFESQDDLAAQFVQ